MSSTNPGEDLFPALEALSRLIVPHIKTVIFAALVLNQFPIFPDFNALLSQLSSPLILVVALYFGGIWTLPNGRDDNNKVSWRSLLGPFFDFQTVSSRVGTYFKIGSLISLAYYLSTYYSLPLPFQPWVQYMFIAITSAMTAVAYLFAPISKIYGPLRFCYLEHAQTYWLVVNWWSLTAVVPFFSPTLLPIFGFCLISVSIGTWVHIYFAYREKVRTIAWTVSENAARAKAAAEEARDFGAMARKYEEQMTTCAAEARRDAVSANSVKLTDFFDCAARAWSALGEATAPAEDAIIKARRMIDSAIICEESEKVDDKQKAENERLAMYLRQAAENAHEKARETVALLRAAQASVRGSENAARQDDVSRRQAEHMAENASNTAKSVSDTVAGIQDAERRAAWAGGAAARRAEEAVTMATNGEIEEAKKAVAASESAFQVAEESAKIVREGMEAAQRGLQEWLQSNRQGM
ncbi:hypothetical protein F53441_1504 [Fusarium austroafricanum]|uniref:Uncharacterized protein n=1 Tax=Fusarium austroafricanum TaxID=2364996 RepID=A0A8H4P255_9HYPO|nr:hypothetical protein F53441_1504 [Fusarium austroafricanum]